MPGRRRLAGCALLTGLVLAARLAPAPALVDISTGLPASGARLEFPLAHAALGPLSVLADVAACQSARADLALLFFLFTAGFAFFRFFVLAEDLARWQRPAPALRAFGIYALLLFAALAFGALAPRPAARLVIDDPDSLIVDFHSHCSASWDGRRSFSPEANAAWHERMGFDAGFVTDHNVFAGSAQAHAMSRLTRERGAPYLSLEGEELTLDGAHVVALGNRALIDARAYDDGPAGLQRFLREAGPKHGALALMSLPEYSQHHWQDLDRLVEWGADGFELAASSPRGLEFPRARLERVAALCRARGLLALAATDNHGYGGAACVWNIVRLPGWRALGPDEIQIQLIAALRRGGFASARAVERPRLEVPRDWTVWLHGPRALFDAYRRLPWLHCFFTFVFIWAVWLFPRSEGKIRAHP